MIAYTHTQLVKELDSSYDTTRKYLKKMRIKKEGKFYIFGDTEFIEFKNTIILQRIKYRTFTKQA
jgi:hypothetical protein